MDEERSRDAPAVGLMAAKEASDLYGLPLEDFTRERDRLVRGLRHEGRREEAAAVAARRKPTTDAWALNQMARRHPDKVEALGAAHRALREAGDGHAMREASESRSRLLDELLAATASILAEEGHSSAGPVRDRITRTLLAAAGDPETEQALRDGVLARTAEISSQWPSMSLPSMPEPTDPEDETAWREEVERLEATALELSTRAGELRRVARQARDGLDRAREEAEAAERAAREAETEAREAEAAAKSARRRR